ncbi:MAG TPA: exodeoxyribonuclease VII large subunit [Phycisphaerae bacterium]|nr:exodeoxyribonuclease VII large subunit [Phycisphaerae bacterium]
MTGKMGARWASFFDEPKQEAEPGKQPKAARKAGRRRAGKKSDPETVGAGGDESPGSDAAPGAAAVRLPEPMTVSALLARVKRALGDALPQRVQVVGEISNFKLHSSGHMYFRLKDAETAVDAVMFRTAAAGLKFTPADGLEVVAEGRVDVYEARGQLQLYVERITPKGAGALELAFRQLQEKLQREGLFDPARKKPLPRFPRAIGVVTAATGAAVRDIARTLVRRWPAAAVYLVATLVQGEGAAEQIAEAVRLLDANADRYGIDVIIVGRGGGSLEDLWAFNEEIVARAIFAAETPVISAVGHEVDVSISDLVADVRAATPTGAAELAVPDRTEVRRNVMDLAGRGRRAVEDDLQAARAALDAVRRSVVFRDPTHRSRMQMQRVDELSHRLRAGLRERLARGRGRLEPAANRLASQHPTRLHERARGRIESLVHRLAWALGGRTKRAGDRLAESRGRLWAVHPVGRVRLARQQVAAAARQLEAMSYRSVVSRGFTVTRGPEGRILRSAGEVRPGDGIETELVDGRIASRVGGTSEGGSDREETTAQNAPDAERVDDNKATRRKPKQDKADDGPSLFD